MDNERLSRIENVISEIKELLGAGNKINVREAINAALGLGWLIRRIEEIEVVVEETMDKNYVLAELWALKESYNA